MPYQTAKNTKSLERTSSKRWIVGLCLCALSAISIFIMIKQSKEIQADIDATIATALPSEEDEEALEPLKDEQPDAETIHSIASMAAQVSSPVVPTRITEATVTELDQAMAEIEVPLPDPQTTESITKILENLDINVITSDKAIIEGEIFNNGDFIDTNRHIKLLRKSGNALVFEIDRVTYSIVP